ncbi:MAG: tRNA (guanosine(46)-N7)-methyltransferase TrmB [Clostridia bacterium]|nr:tRNA (guanosine(46)-N7)-methyltransferase TrmB [Clostridia bacterium]
MRPRTKKHFDERFDKCRYLIEEQPEENKGKWRSLYERNDAPLHLEIGCGKGAFITGKAMQHPEVCFVAAELVPNVLLAALEKVDGDPEIQNVRFISGNAKKLGEYFEDGEVDAIYLNFSDPWPRPKQFKNRLTHPNFLEIYKKILKSGGKIYQKTDNKGLFDFSVRKYVECGFQIEILEEAPADNVMTEYETRFTGMGMPIYRVIATAPAK